MLWGWAWSTCLLSLLLCLFSACGAGPGLAQTAPAILSGSRRGSGFPGSPRLLVAEYPGAGSVLLPSDFVLDPLGNTAGQVLGPRPRGSGFVQLESLLRTEYQHAWAVLPGSDISCVMGPSLLTPKLAYGVMLVCGTQNSLPSHTLGFMKIK